MINGIASDLSIFGLLLFQRLTSQARLDGPSFRTGAPSQSLLYSISLCRMKGSVGTDAFYTLLTSATGGIRPDLSPSG